MNFSKSQKIVLGFLGFLALLLMLGVLGVIPLFRQKENKAEISVWGVDDQSAVNEVINLFNKEHPNIRVSYKRIDAARYETELIDALAAGNGPDVFMFRSGWVGKHGNKVAVAPEDKFVLSGFRDFFPQIAEQDFVRGDNIYALPIYIDTLCLIYNRDVLDRQGVAIPPQTWNEFKTIAVSKGVGTSMGGYSPLVRRSADIIDALFLQTGADLSLQNKNFVRINTAEGLKALSYYLGFKAPSENSVTAFAGGRAGMIIDYHSAGKEIKAKNPFINLNFALLPQFNPNSPVTVADYYGLAVSSRTPQLSVSWSFVVFAATDQTAAKTYFTASGNPPALRSLIQEYSNHQEFGVFSRQSLTARGWGAPDREAVYNIYGDMIKSVTGGSTARDALQTAETALNQLIYEI